MVGFHSTVWVGNVGQLALVDLLLGRNYSDFLAIKILEVSRLQKLRRRDVLVIWWIYGGYMVDMVDIWWIYDGYGGYMVGLVAVWEMLGSLL